MRHEAANGSRKPNHSVRIAFIEWTFGERLRHPPVLWRDVNIQGVRKHDTWCSTVTHTHLVFPFSKELARSLINRRVRGSGPFGKRSSARSR